MTGRDTSGEVSHAEILAEVRSVLDGEDDAIAAMASVVCVLHHAFARWHWTGFYRVIAPELLAVGPYQGGHGCTRIPFARGVCGAAARTAQTQRVPDVDAFPGHIACSSTTRSELVVPVCTPDGRVLGVLDVDSDDPDAFDARDQALLEAVCAQLGSQFSRL
jgi:GAF domain-containing protein